MDKSRHLKIGSGERVVGSILRMPGEGAEGRGSTQCQRLNYLFSAGAHAHKISCKIARLNKLGSLDN